MDGYMEKLLFIDLSNKTVEEKDLSVELKNKFVGGKGFGAKLLYDLVPAGTDPLSPDNVLMFFPGPLTGTLAPAMRGCAVSKSPLTGTFSDSYFGGSFAAEIKYAGYDGIVIQGKSKEPVYIWIDSDNVQIVAASHLWGKDTFETNTAIKEELKDDTVKISCIGPAGENLVRFALLSCEYNRHAGRGGIGAVMGSKNLKAVAIRGKYGVPAKDPKEFMKSCDKAFEEIRENPSTQGFTLEGTIGSVPFANETNLLPIRNFNAGQSDKVESLYPDKHKETLWLRDTACLSCPIRCSKVGIIKTGKYAGTVTDIIEYESTALMGSNLELGDVRTISYLVKLCDGLGLDSMSTGSGIAFAMEAYEKGLISEDMYDMPIEFGNEKVVEKLINDIAYRKNEIGDMLAEGVKRASEKLGPESDAFALHTKGLETPAWGPRTVPGMGLAYMTGDRGGCHQRGFPINYEIGGTWKDEPVERLGTKNKAEIVVYLQDYLAALDAFVKCDFGQYAITCDTYLEMFKNVTGITYTEEELLQLGERIWNQVKLFNLREGFTRKDDRLPRRFFEQPLPTGEHKGSALNEQEMQQLLDEYYELRGWNEEGIPSDSKLRELELQDIECIYNME